LADFIALLKNLAREYGHEVFVAAAAANARLQIVFARQQPCQHQHQADFRHYDIDVYRRAMNRFDRHVDAEILVDTRAQSLVADTAQNIMRRLPDPKLWRQAHDSDVNAIGKDEAEKYVAIG
jgi:hypothetical protein